MSLLSTVTLPLSSSPPLTCLVSTPISLYAFLPPSAPTTTPETSPSSSPSSSSSPSLSPSGEPSAPTSDSPDFPPEMICPSSGLIFPSSRTMMILSTKSHSDSDDSEPPPAPAPVPVQEENPGEDDESVQKTIPDEDRDRDLLVYTLVGPVARILTLESGESQVIQVEAEVWMKKKKEKKMKEKEEEMVGSDDDDSDVDEYDDVPDDVSDSGSEMCLKTFDPPASFFEFGVIVGSLGILKGGGPPASVSDVVFLMSNYSRKKRKRFHAGSEILARLSTYFQPRRNIVAWIQKEAVKTEMGIETDEEEEDDDSWWSVQSWANLESFVDVRSTKGSDAVFCMKLGVREKKNFAEASSASAPGPDVVVDEDEDENHRRRKGKKGLRLTPSELEWVIQRVDLRGIMSVPPVMRVTGKDTTATTDVVHLSLEPIDWDVASSSSGSHNLIAVSDEMRVSVWRIGGSSDEDDIEEEEEGEMDRPCHQVERLGSSEGKFGIVRFVGESFLIGVRFTDFGCEIVMFALPRGGVDLLKVLWRVRLELRAAAPLVEACSAVLRIWDEPNADDVDDPTTPKYAILAISSSFPWIVVLELQQGDDDQMNLIGLRHAELDSSEPILDFAPLLKVGPRGPTFGLFMKTPTQLKLVHFPIRLLDEGFAPRPAVLPPSTTTTQEPLSAPDDEPAQEILELEQALLAPFEEYCHNLSEAFESERKQRIAQGERHQRELLSVISHAVRESLPEIVSTSLRKKTPLLVRKISEKVQVQVDDGVRSASESVLTTLPNVVRPRRQRDPSDLVKGLQPVLSVGQNAIPQTATQLLKESRDELRTDLVKESATASVHIKRKLKNSMSQINSSLGKTIARLQTSSIRIQKTQSSPAPRRRRAPPDPFDLLRKGSHKEAFESVLSQRSPTKLLTFLQSALDRAGVDLLEADFELPPALCLSLVSQLSRDYDVATALKIDWIQESMYRMWELELDRALVGVAVDVVSSTRDSMLKFWQGRVQSRQVTRTIKFLRSFIRRYRT